MNKEDLKTLFLILLVCISIFLTKKLWIKIPSEMIPVFKIKEGIGSSYLFSDMLIPDKILLNFSDKNHTLLYSDEKYGLWPGGKMILKKALSEKNYKVSHMKKEEFLKYQNNKSINFYFAEEMNTYILAKALDVKEPNNITERISKVNNIYIYLEKGNPFIIFCNDNTYLKISNLNIQTKVLREILSGIEVGEEYTRYYSIRDTLGSNNDIYIPFEMVNEIPSVFVQNEIRIDNRDEIRMIAEKFFSKNIDYLREIVENNGSTIYIYNQKVLKIHKNGLLEYFSPLDEPVTERNLYISLNTAADFISSHSGPPKEMYLDKIEEIKSDNNLGYKFTFKYRIRGIPLIIGDDEVEDFIQIEVFNKYVKAYKRFVRKDMHVPIYKEAIEQENMLSAFEVIDMNFDLLEERYVEDMGITEDVKIENLNEKIVESIEDISLAYFDPCKKESNEKLIGVWTINIKGRIYVFDVYTGELIYEKGKV
ncbi:YycH family regulatory protein [Sporanaerobacter acetigenes]|uniref:YycH family regulatory protein n=1 Tax=Sporanaerobacter acetigenes TaxID=165813 RepID=UPI0033171709